MGNIANELTPKPIDNAKKKATQKFKDATSLLNYPDELQNQADKEGYLFFRGLMPQKRLLELRRQILEILHRRNLLDSSKELMDGIADYEAVNQLSAESMKGYGFPADLNLDIQKLELFHEIAFEPALLNVFQTLFQVKPFPHPKTIARVVLPHDEIYATPPHQDIIYIQGSPVTWTAWFPLSDCPRELGGLSILEGSHQLGVVDVAPQRGAGGLESILCGLDMEWAEGDYALGDVIIFNSQTVHKALPKSPTNKIRLSCDFRYQPINQVIDRSSLKPHTSHDWEEIYKGWINDALQYYWKNEEFTFTDWDESLLWKKEKIC